MLVFIDECGDSGLKIGKGSSRYFIIALVVFDDNEEALACDTRIELLKRELGWSQDSEFHFHRNSKRIREIFLREVSRYNFFYYGVVINKDPRKLYGEGFKNKSSFYKYACGLVFQNAKETLEDSIVVVDSSGSLEFKKRLSKYLKNKFNGNKRVIKKVKMQRSESNNLIQLADYVAGTINRSINGRSGGEKLRKMISHREINVQVWPK